MKKILSMSGYGGNDRVDTKVSGFFLSMCGKSGCVLKSQKICKCKSR